MADKLYKSPLDRALKGDARVDSAVIYFQKEKYADAIRMLRSAGGALSIDGQELLAHAHYKSRQFPEAAAAFETIAQERIRPFSERSEWFHCLSLLAQLPAPAKKKDLDALLTKMAADSDHAYYRQAVELKQDLEQ